MKQEIIKALKGYEFGQVKLESFVESSSYQPVMDTLVDLNLSSDYSLIGNPSSQFIQALSPKSKGLMITSALLAGNDSLYKPIYASIAPSIGDLYPQDLPSLLGGAHAPSAISEMTRRASGSLNFLERFNQGLFQISKSSPASASLSSVSMDIKSSSWVEQHPHESKNLMTLVSAAPESLEIGELKGSALSRYLKAGLKLASVAGVLAGIGIVGLYGASFAHKSSDVSVVDMGARATIESIGADGKVDQRKIVAFGEVGSQSLAKFYFDKISGQSVSEAITSFSNHSRQGEAMLVKDGASPGVDACVVQAHQNARTSKDGNFYLFTDNTQGIADKNLFDFFYESHETTHCFSYYDTAPHDRAPTYYEQAYSISLNEVSSDLGAVLDYMRVTGSSDLYDNHIRPFRISNVNDVTHKTAWALDIILKDVNPTMLQGKSKEDIPEITRLLMEKNFQAKDGTFSPGNLSSRGTTTIDTPAANALFHEIMAAKNIHNQRYPDLVKALKDDIRDAMSSQQAKYADVAPKDVIDAAKAGYGALAIEFNLEPLKPVNAPAVEVAKPVETMLSAYR